ncbi:Swi3-domain-containing protein [Mytilinidion resinicola]|uniref:Chromosome segregation in meiosis protein n=1 Tax=Mytilinidion resinicola TaxID=574789 RepID=A0A6A6Y4K9_9PEZI|nr:Swi3-domain-containing protein [Mytilinidion resinicola]KAF2803736.1 Swi3-domain-containing protein [Mytilinidion resinicola]
MAPQSPPADDFDDLFLDDPAMEAAFRELDANTAAQTSRRDTTSKRNAVSADAAIDEEIKIVKKRQPIPKLDAPLLLSPAGIPKLRRISKDRLKFKGKGHEYSDVARLLNTYQLWLDDLYPRAKFADALTMIEKLGHSKQLQMMRKVWIEEGKPKTAVESEEDMDGDLPRNQSSNQVLPEAHSSVVVPRDQDSRSERAAVSSERQATVERDDVPDQDELDALLAEEEALIMKAESMMKPAPRVPARPARPAAPLDDDLDALLAEEDAMMIEAASAGKTASVMPSRPPKHSAPREDEFADEFANDLDAMGDMW